MGVAEIRKKMKWGPPMSPLKRTVHKPQGGGGERCIRRSRTTKSIKPLRFRDV